MVDDEGPGLSNRVDASGIIRNGRFLPLQYVDFALWQRRWLSGAVLEAPTLAPRTPEDVALLRGLGLPFAVTEQESVGG